MHNDLSFGHTVLSYESPLGNSVRIIRQTFEAIYQKPHKRISLISGLHGDELEGVFLCFRLSQYLRNLKETQPKAFKGEINIYPAVNPQALGNASRLWPFFSTDMNRMFGGRGGTLPKLTAKKLLEDIKSRSDIALDLHSSNLHLRESPQIRIISGFDKKIIPLAQYCNVDVIWVHPITPVFECTLGYNLNQLNVPTLVVEAGVCLHLDQEISNQLFHGVLHLLYRTGVLNLSESEIPTVRTPLLINSDYVAQINANQPGFFVPKITPGSSLIKGDVIGDLIDPIQGKQVEKIISPETGYLFTLRELPLTYEGSVLARIASKEPIKS